MKVNQKKANQIKGLFATLNSIELNEAISRQDESTFSSPEYVFFECVISYSEIFKEFDCELFSHKMRRSYESGINGYKYISTLCYGGHWMTVQTLWDDKCSYYEFRYVVEFARKAIKAGGTRNMKHASHKVTVEMPDYLNFEIKE